jgi:hypothetical protein
MTYSKIFLLNLQDLVLTIVPLGETLNNYALIESVNCLQLTVIIPYPELTYRLF